MAAIESHNGSAAWLRWRSPWWRSRFLRVEQDAGRPPGAARMFKIRPFRGAIIATAGMTFGMYGVLFLQLLTWQSTGRLDAVGAGLALVPMAVVFVLVSPLLRRVAGGASAPVSWRGAAWRSSQRPC